MATVFDRYLTEDEERTLIRAIDQYRNVWARRDSAIVRLLRATGIRVGSACGLTVGDARAALREPHRLALADAHAKRGQGYSIHCTKRARQALRDLLAIHREIGLARRDDLPLLVSRQTASSGLGMTRRAVQKRFVYWREQAGLIGLSPHWLRHTLAQRLMRNSTARDPRGVVQGQLGHRSITSSAVYTRPSKEDVRDAMDEVA